MEQELTKLLQISKKTLNDVSYVSYATYDNRAKVQTRCFCSIQDYMNTIANVPSIYELHQYYDISIVGKNWWIDYDFRGDPYLHTFPTKPAFYKPMC
jgi:hypothetical protein